MSAPSAFIPKCPICLRSGWKGHPTLVDHMTGHTSRALADELVKVLRREHSLKRELHPEAYPDKKEKAPPPTRPCEHKESYPTEYDATRALLSAWAKSPVDPRRREKRVYHCELPHGCGKWHVNSQEKHDAQA